MNLIDSSLKSVLIPRSQNLQCFLFTYFDVLPYSKIIKNCAWLFIFNIPWKSIKLIWLEIWINKNNWITITMMTPTSNVVVSDLACWFYDASYGSVIEFLIWRIRAEVGNKFLGIFLRDTVSYQQNTAILVSIVVMKFNSNTNFSHFLAKVLTFMKVVLTCFFIDIWNQTIEIRARNVQAKPFPNFFPFWNVQFI